VSGTAALELGAPAIQAKSRRWQAYVFKGLLNGGPATFALALLLIIVGTAVFAQSVAPHDPLEIEMARRFAPPVFAGGSWDHPLGTDQVGRDVLSRIIYGSRASLLVSTLSVLGAAIIGVAIGLVAGYRGGRIDELLMRIADLQRAFPFLVLAIAIITVVGAGVGNLIALLAIWGWAETARLTRGTVQALKKREFIEAAKAMGAPGWRIAVNHILPNSLSPLLVLWTFSIASLIVVESSLSFLGFGIPPPEPTWGNMLAEGRQYLRTAWWLGTFPGLAIMVTVLAVNIIGDRLRELLDPRLRS
jgi:peptide/nickel transport system permease protein